MDSIKRTIFLNELKLLFFLLLISFIIMLSGFIITEIYGLGIEGMFIFFLITAGVNIFSVFFSKTFALKSQHAVPMKKEDFPEYYDMVYEMCALNNIKMPELYYINTPAMNAFAAGRSENDAACAVTAGLLKNAPLEEIKGVIGHELAHIKHKDILVTGIIAVMLSAVTIAASYIQSASMYGGPSRKENGNSNALLMIIGLAASLLMPVIALLIRMAVSRSREYTADADGAKICGNPMLLAKALYRISRNGAAMPYADEASAPMYISNPLKNGSFENLFSTHPDINDRIERLKQMQQDF